MTRWNVAFGDILDFTADGLICSANPSLNLSGGVGGAILLRYGNDMQEFLHAFLRDNKLKYVATGSAVLSPPFGSRFKLVAHAVAIDAFYDTSSSQILATYKNAVDGLLAGGCSSIVAACLGCGYGRFNAQWFTVCAQDLMALDFRGLAEFTFVSTNQELVGLLTEVVSKSNK